MTETNLPKVIDPGAAGPARRTLKTLARRAALAGLGLLALLAGPAQAIVVDGCDPMTGVLVRRDLAQLLNPTRNGPTPQYTSPDRDGTIGTLWTPSCEPTNTTGNGSCFRRERQQVIVAELTPSLGTKLIGKELPAGVKLSVVWVVLRQVKNDSTTDFLSFFMLSPGAQVGAPPLSAEVQASYTKAWFALYRVMTEAPVGTNIPSADTMWVNLASYGQFLALGGLIKDSSVETVQSFLGTPILPPPFLLGEYDGARVGASISGVSAGLSVWAGPYAIDINKADPTNIGAILYGPAAPGGTPAALATIPGDLIKIQPDLVAVSGALGQPLNAILTALVGTTSPISWLNTLRVSYSTGILLDQLDMGSFKTSTGIEQGGSIEMVIRVPLILALDFAPGGSAAATQASNWWNSVKNDSKWQAWAKNARANANFSGGPYMAIRYTKKIDLAGRTPATVGNLALWRSIQAKYGFDPVAVGKLFGPDGSAAIQMYSGASVSIGNPLGLLSLTLPGTKTRLGVGDLTKLAVGASVSESFHDLIDAWHNTPGQSGVNWKRWESCVNTTYPEPAAASYGPAFQAQYAPGPYSVLNPAAPKYPWPTSGGIPAFAADQVEKVGNTATGVAAEVASAASIVSNFAKDAADKAANLAKETACKLIPSTCPKKPLVLEDKGSLTGTVKFYHDEKDARAGHDGWCYQVNANEAKCTVYNGGNGNATIVFPQEGTRMFFGGYNHRALRQKPADGWLPYCVPEWNQRGFAFHSTGAPFQDKVQNRYYCAYWQ